LSYRSDLIDAIMAHDPAARSRTEVRLLYPGYKAVMAHRRANWFFRHNMKFTARLISENIKRRTGIEIHPAASIGRGVLIDHGTGVVIGETTIIGKRVKLYQGVTLGALSTRDVAALRGKKRHPTLENDVTVYPGASILGGETVIGRAATITANAFVTQSVPPHTRVSVKNPELEYKNRRPTPPTEFKQDLSPDFQI